MRYKYNPKYYPGYTVQKRFLFWWITTKVFGTPEYAENYINSCKKKINEKRI